MRQVCPLLLAFAVLCVCVDAAAGVLTKAQLARRFPAPFIVGDKEAGLPVWPVFKQNMTSVDLVGYVFESADLAPVPGFAGVPMNLLVAIDAQGSFLDVAVLSQHEPVFLDGLGEGPLLDFVKQYKGLSLKRNIAVGGKADGESPHLDGVAKATASVRILHQSVLAAALKVARAKLGFAQGRDPDRIARIRPEMFATMGVRKMLDDGLIAHLRVSNREVERLFEGSAGAGLDAQAIPDDAFIDLYLAWVSVPTVGRNLLLPPSWTRLSARLDAGDHALMVMARGRYRILGDDFVRGSVPRRLILRQDGIPIEMRDLDMDLRLVGTALLPGDEVAVFRVIGQAGLDAATPLDFALRVTREKGIVYPERITREIALRYRMPEAYYSAPAADDKGWRGVWVSRRGELLALGAGLAVLAAALLAQRRLTADASRFAWIRAGFLLYTVVFIGYVAQAQLSIVNITGVAQALRAGRGLDFLLYDPPTVVLWAFVLVSLFVWGRGTFCGWLCPFGALQEFTGMLGRLLRMPQLRVRALADRRLKTIKYGVLALIVASALFMPAMRDRLVEFEPFKTAITLAFMRSWPFVLYAAGLLALSMVSYKFFCRYLCPSGAALALLGRVRMLNWIARRAECGTPCQTCRHRCSYQAIDRAGQVDYTECFQCMECVVIHASDEQCAPRIAEHKRQRRIPIAPAVSP